MQANKTTPQQAWTALLAEPWAPPSAIRLRAQPDVCLTDGAAHALQLSTCHPFKTHRWRLVRLTDGSVEVQTLSDLYLGCLAPSATDPKALGMRGCDGRSQTRWQPMPDGTLVHVDTKQCLDVPGGKPADGTAVHLAACTGGATQSFDLPAY